MYKRQVYRPPGRNSDGSAPDSSESGASGQGVVGSGTGRRRSGPLPGSAARHERQAPTTRRARPATSAPRRPSEASAGARRLPAKRHGVVTDFELDRLGMSADQRARRVRAGLLIRLHRGVYAVPGAPASFEQRITAASLAGGTGAAVSHRSAARLWGLRDATSARL